MFRFGSHSYQQVSQLSELDYWEVAIEDILIDDKSFGACGDNGCKAAVDTGSSLVSKRFNFR